ncbi:hypothetical protein [Megasphaera sueciensis]|uniref:hypothetical protein n=1 Tax=Megasphaera sueciensis TaxID=349094 RepID=UPI003D05C80B
MGINRISRNLWKYGRNILSYFNHYRKKKGSNLSVAALLFVISICIMGCGHVSSVSKMVGMSTSDFLNQKVEDTNPYAEFVNYPPESAEYAFYQVNQYAGPYFNGIREKIKQAVTDNPQEIAVRKEDGQWMRTNGTSDYYYCGELKENKPDGIGIVFKKTGYKKPNTQEDAVVIEDAGEYKKGRLNGYGQIYKRNQATGHYYLSYEGTVQDGTAEGNGISYQFISVSFLKKTAYCINIGNFHKGELQGNCKIYVNGSLLYEGEYKDNEYNGKGILYYPDGGKKYEGEFSSGQYDGKGTSYLKDGSVEYKGKWRNNDYAG